VCDVLCVIISVMTPRLTVLIKVGDVTGGKGGEGRAGGRCVRTYDVVEVAPLSKCLL
jgi:hypothetical protein